MYARSSARRGRRGAILLVVIALLTVLTVVGITFVYYASSEANVARIAREAENKPDAALDGSDALTVALGTLLYDATDSVGNNAPDLTNGLRGHSLMRAMYGWSGTPGQHATPYTGVGTFHEPLDLSGFGFGNNIDRARVVNYQYIPASAAGGMFLDPEHTGYRYLNPTAVGVGGVQVTPLVPAQDWNATRPQAAGTLGNRTYVARNAPYTYPDLKDFYLASLSPLTGEVLVPSFHRDWVFRHPAQAAAEQALSPTNPNWYLPAGRLSTVRPRPWDHLTNIEQTAAAASVGLTLPLPPTLTPAQAGQLGQWIAANAPNTFPPVPPNADGSFTGDVQNLPGAAGVQRGDGIWVDLGLPPRVYNGKLVKPLVSLLVADLDGRLNVNAHGNARNAPKSGVAASNVHTSYAGYGPWEINLAKGIGNPAEVNNFVYTRQYAVAPNQGAVGRNGYARQQNARLPNGGQLTSRVTSPVSWDGTADRLTGPFLPRFLANGTGNPFIPDFGFLGATTGTDAATPPGFTDGVNGVSGNGSGSNPEFNHPGLYNPIEWPSTPGGVARTYSNGDLRRLHGRYADRPDVYAVMDVNGVAPTNVGVGNNPLYPFVPSPTATTPDRYRLDPAHRNRLRTTTLSTSYDRPGLTPNFLSTGTNLALTYTPPTAALPPGSAGTGLNNPAFNSSFPAASAAPGTVTDFSIAGQKQWRHARAVLGAVDVNRPLVDYRLDTTASLSPGNTNVTQSNAAWADRQALARDIFARLILATGANAGVYLPGDTDYLAHPSGYSIKLLAPLNGTEFHALRYLAQLAANIVDYVDADDVSTAFVWNPLDPANPFDAANFAATDMGQRVVFGVERPRLVLNELYAEVTNDPQEGQVTKQTPVTYTPMSLPMQVRFWAELINPTANAYVGTPGPLPRDEMDFNNNTTGLVKTHYTAAADGADYSAYRLVITRENKSTGGSVSATLLDPANVTGGLPATFSPDIDFDFKPTNPLPTPIPPVKPNRGDFDPDAKPETRLLVVGPPTPTAVNQSVVKFFGPTLQSLVTSDNPTGAPGTTQKKSMVYQLPKSPAASKANADTNLEDVRKRHIVLLRRLANPYLPLTVPGTPDVTNPYITVDYVDHVRANDALYRFDLSNPMDDPTRQARGQNPTGGFDAENQRYSLGKVAALRLAMSADAGRPAATDAAVRLPRLDGGVSAVGRSQRRLQAHTGSAQLCSGPADGTGIDGAAGGCQNGDVDCPLQRVRPLRPAGGQPARTAPGAGRPAARGDATVRP